MVKPTNMIPHILRKYKLSKKQQQEEIQHERCIPWFRDKGDETLRLNYNLNANSIVLDLGGYKGEFANNIFEKYGSNIYIFEPVLEYSNQIRERFLNIKKIQAYDYGLAGKDAEIKLGLLNDGSSVFIKSQNHEIVTVKSIVSFIRDSGIEHIDLIKINIEGGEYEVLESLIEKNMLHMITDLQIQFHDFIVPNAKKRMQFIQAQLTKTHELTYQYEFVWENWTLKNK